jgi:hypothetical protein
VVGVLQVDHGAGKGGRDRVRLGSMASRSFSKVGCIRHFYWFVVHYTQSM